MFCGHIDTVGVAGMKAPFDPVERDGRIYGRGSQDMKSGVAAMIDAARVIAESGGLAAGKLVIACVVDEEHASIGADALVTRWRADAAVVTEPTDLQVAIAHKGFEWVEIETEGRAAHGSRPREGRDAIRLMARVLNGLDALDKRLQSKPPHALLGTASLHASLIEGGRELSSYPDRCHLQMERRTIPGEAPGVAAQGGRRAAGPAARGGSRLQGCQQGNVRALAVRDRRRITNCRRRCWALAFGTYGSLRHLVRSACPSGPTRRSWAMRESRRSSTDRPAPDCTASKSGSMRSRWSRAATRLSRWRATGAASQPRAARPGKADPAKGPQHVAARRPFVIVVDTNVTAYLWLPGELTTAAERLLGRCRLGGSVAVAFRVPEGARGGSEAEGVRSGTGHGHCACGRGAAHRTRIRGRDRRGLAVGT